MSSRVGDQLELFLPREAGYVRVPWGGLSPRALTRGHGRFTLKAQAAKSVRDSADAEQLEFWATGEKAPWVYQGAPLLSEPGG